MRIHQLKRFGVLAALTALLASVLAGDAVAGDLPITSLIATTDGQFLISASHDEVRVHSTNDLKIRHRKSLPIRNIYAVALLRDRNQIIVAGGIPGESGDVAILTWPNIDLVSQQRVSEDVIYAIANLTETTIALGGHDCGVYLMDLNTNHQAEKIVPLATHSKPVTDILALAGTDLLLSCSMDQTIRVWDWKKQIMVRSLSNHTKPVRVMSQRPKMEALLPMTASAGDDKTVRLWQPTIGRMVRFKRLKSAVTAVRWSGSGQQIIVGCQDGALHFIQPETLHTDSVANASPGWINQIAVLPNSTDIVFGCSNGILKRLSIPEPKRR